MSCKYFQSAPYVDVNAASKYINKSLFFRGMLTLCSHKPVLTESLHIPVLCLSGKSYPTQSSVELSSDSQTQTATKLSVWPAFHNGVAAGLCLDRKAEVDTTWILFNRVSYIH